MRVDAVLAMWCRQCKPCCSRSAFVGEWMIVRTSTSDPPFFANYSARGQSGTQKPAAQTTSSRAGSLSTQSGDNAEAKTQRAMAAAGFNAPRAQLMMRSVNVRCFCICGERLAG